MAAEKPDAPSWPALVALTSATFYLAALLAAERQTLIIALLAVGIAVVAGAAWLGLLERVSRSFAAHENAFGGYAVLAALAVAGVFHNNHFVLLLMVTVLLYSVATLGLNVQFGYAGVVNFAGASFFGIGAYTSAVLNAQASIPPLVVIVIGGLLAALVGSLLCSRCCAPAATTRRW